MMKVAVLGIGNVLIGDDAVGPTVVSLLDALWEFPEGVVVEDMGTPSLDLAARLSEFDAVIFVDAVSAKAEPGTIRLYTVDEILRHPPGLRLSQHDPSLKETLLTVQLLDACPRHIVLVGVVPQSIEQFGLSTAVEAAVPQAAEAVIEQLSQLGIESKRRTAPAAGAPWWSAA
jgi:hydrogenase maturation protease